jgi:hypothetical protein
MNGSPAMQLRLRERIGQLRSISTAAARSGARRNSVLGGSSSEGTLDVDPGDGTLGTMRWTA